MIVVDETEHVYVVEQDVSLLDDIDGNSVLKKLELCGRTAYKSEHAITPGSAQRFVKMIVERGHESVIEHVSVSVKMITDRGVTHEIVRHRIASYTQESTRFCNYASDRFGNKVWMVRPVFLSPHSSRYQKWLRMVDEAAGHYLELIKEGWKPQEARSVLPNSLKAELCMTANLREWRHFFKLRTAPDAHPQMRDLALKTLQLFKAHIPIIFDDIVESVSR
jgi:thymidylate synthase (FAD)